MQVGDLVEYKKDKNWGIGIVVEFIDSGLMNHYPWIKVHWSRWNRTNQGPVDYYKKVNK
jgi:hypothetical protein|tara:strand:- start:608 stop:784 length:177 start_codon:yes stop_codon:yes gene_type:complete